MRAGWAYFASWPQTAQEFAGFAQKKLDMPLLVMGGEQANGELLARQGNLVATNVTSVIVADTGHWLMEERPAQATAALVKFLGP